MTTETPQPDLRPLHVQIADHQRDLVELRAAMDARAALDPDTPEFREALAYEDELLERIHQWSLGQR